MSAPTDLLDGSRAQKRPMTADGLIEGVAALLALCDAQRTELVRRRAERERLRAALTSAAHNLEYLGSVPPTDWEQVFAVKSAAQARAALADTG